MILMQSNTSVTQLDLSDCGLGTEGGVAIASMLKENCYITHLVIDTIWQETCSLEPYHNTHDQWSGISVQALKRKRRDWLLPGDCHSALTAYVQDPGFESWVVACFSISSNHLIILLCGLTGSLRQSS